MAWLVQGSYYHSDSFQNKWGQEGRDALAKLRLLGAYVNGVRIEMVIELQKGTFTTVGITLSFAPWVYRGNDQHPNVHVCGSSTSFRKPYTSTISATVVARQASA